MICALYYIFQRDDNKVKQVSPTPVALCLIFYLKYRFQRNSFVFPATAEQLQQFCSFYNELVELPIKSISKCDRQVCFIHGSSRRKRETSRNSMINRMNENARVGISLLSKTDKIPAQQSITCFIAFGVFMKLRSSRLYLLSSYLTDVHCVTCADNGDTLIP